MRAEDANTGDEVVYLLTELRSAERGPVFEIGSRARVLGADGDRLTLAVANGNGENVVTCSRSLVTRRRRPLPTRRAFLRADARPAA
jgi:hypothetical protein